jgi:hypothetical protein
VISSSAYTPRIPVPLDTYTFLVVTRKEYFKMYARRLSIQKTLRSSEKYSGYGETHTAAYEGGYAPLGDIPHHRT